MGRSITQRELRNVSGEIMRAVDRGESFVVTRNGVPVGELSPVRSRRFVDTDAALAAFRGAPHIDAARLRDDLDAVLDQDPTPRGPSTTRPPARTGASTPPSSPLAARPGGAGPST